MPCGKRSLPSTGDSPREGLSATDTEQDVQLTLTLPEDAFPKSSIMSRLSPAKPTIVYETYWRFAVERQGVFFRKLEGLPAPWTTDPILARHKFTNAYRASDRVSQYLIRNVIYEGEQSPEEVFFRTMLFKLFNRIETWEMLQEQVDNDYPGSLFLPEVRRHFD